MMATDAAHSRKSRLAVPSGGSDDVRPLLASGNSPSATIKRTVSASASAAAAASGTGSLQASSSATTAPTNNPMLYLQRLTDVRQMDIQSALDQMKTLLSTRPQTVYKTAYYRKQTKNHWARDDPAFVALQLVFLVIAGIAYSVAFRIKLGAAISFLLSSILCNWLGFGLLLSTVGREIANRHLVSHQSSSHVRQQVEWLYAFDIHCNSFFPVFVVLCKFFSHSEFGL
jgi:UNC-50 family